MLITPHQLKFWERLQDLGIKDFNDLIHKFSDPEFKNTAQAAELIRLFDETLVNVTSERVLY